MLSETNRALIEAILLPWRVQGVEMVYAAECCGRMWVGKTRPLHCSTCKAEVPSEAVPTSGYVARND